MSPLLVNEHLTPHFNSFKKEILCSMLSIPIYSLSEKNWLWACQNISHGGIGLTDSIKTSFAAYLASFAEVSKGIIEEFPQLSKFFDEDNPNPCSALSALGFSRTMIPPFVI